MQPQGSVPLLQAPPRLRPARQPRLHLGDWDLSSRSEFTPGSSCCPRASGPCNLEPVPLPYPSLPPPLRSSNFFFPPSLNFTHPSARLLHSSHPIGGPHPWRGPAPCPPGANPPRACRVLGRSPERPASDGSAPGAAGGAGGRAGRAGEGGGRAGEAEELAAGLKAAVSWQLGQALVSALQLRSGAATFDPGTGLWGFCASPTDCSCPSAPPADLPAPPPQPFPPLGRRTPGASGRR